jgi:hypothetical protein
VSLWKRVEPFIYSRKNIVGSALGLVGLALLFFGVTGGIVGLGVVAGLYAIGYLVTPPERGLALTLFNTEDTRDIRAGLDKLLSSIRYRVADDIFQKCGSIAHSIVMTLPANGAGIDPADPNVNLIRQTALSYLPQALDAYLAIPRIYAERRQLDNGKTAHDVLMDQLNVMDAKLHDVADAVAKNDTDRLMSNVRFLQERFADSQLQVAGVKAAATDTTSGDSPPAGGPRIL